MAMEQLLTKYSDLEEKQATIFGRIYSARKNDDGELVAIKEDTRSKRSNEPDFHQQLGKHPNIVQFHDSFSDKRRSFIVMELCKYGSLKEFVDDKGTLSLKSVQSIFKQVVDALEHIHEKKLVYRNLEPYHVLISEISEDGVIFVKLCDFGAVRVIEKQGLLQPSVDFKSLGSLLFFMITGSIFINTPEVYDKISEFSETAAEFINMLVSADSDFSFQDIKSHPFYNAEFDDELSFCKEELTELYESMIGDEKFNSSWIEYVHEDEQDENMCNDNVEPKMDTQMDPIEEAPKNDNVEPKMDTQMDPIEEAPTNPSLFTHEDENVEPIQVPERAHNNAVDSTPAEETRKNPPLFACLFAFVRAVCGYK